VSGVFETFVFLAVLQDKNQVVAAPATPKERAVPSVFLFVSLCSRTQHLMIILKILRQSNLILKVYLKIKAKLKISSQFVKFWLKANICIYYIFMDLPGA
jgi:hypothetical protein